MNLMDLRQGLGLASRSIMAALNRNWCAHRSYNAAKILRCAAVIFPTFSSSAGSRRTRILIPIRLFASYRSCIAAGAHCFQREDEATITEGVGHSLGYPLRNLQKVIHNANDPCPV
jgi:hypothetical protein